MRVSEAGLPLDSPKAIPWPCPPGGRSASSMVTRPSTTESFMEERVMSGAYDINQAATGAQRLTRSQCK